MFEFIFNGTATSSSIPAIQCLTDPNTTCKTCPTTLTPEGKKNIRRNTSGILRKRITEVLDDGNGGMETQERDLVIVIDVGKTFLQAAMEWFPKYGLRKIDAVLLTHSHADATNGLDDLRGWTLNAAIQSHLDIYVNAPTFNEIKRAFPYLVSSGLATGGGAVPEFRWHMIEDSVSFSVGGENGFWITPVAVDHGLQFPPPKPISNIPLDRIHGPLNLDSPGTRTPAPISTSQPAATDQTSPLEPPRREPYKCLSFIFNNSLVYMSDVSNIPDEQWPTLLQPPTQFEMGSPAAVEHVNVRPTRANHKVFIVDVLRPFPYASHFGLDQAVQAVRKMGAARNYILGFNHDMNHDQWTAIGEAIGQPRESWAQCTDPDVKAALDLVSEGSAAWVRPAFDGLRIVIPEPEDGLDASLVDGDGQ
ncbi:hypothetical protein M407DRAFT_16528 [Tulasnella calospora MUT 4182]|uniref:Metallo-beta-lactamase domain-containing protein n=1 Tax=Tulasnella calospora MUT 4182 TaxID=1051891 RepID=A0A0C3LKC5_9AGAM|nr:hypothetical protein M407DRAFT_16528 [Tulasnella calospora MUT 4182]